MSLKKTKKYICTDHVICIETILKSKASHMNKCTQRKSYPFVFLAVYHNLISPMKSIALTPECTQRERESPKEELIIYSDFKKTHTCPVVETQMGKSFSFRSVWYYELRVFFCNYRVCTVHHWFLLVTCVANQPVAGPTGPTSYLHILTVCWCRPVQRVIVFGFFATADDKPLSSHKHVSCNLLNLFTQNKRGVMSFTPGETSWLHAGKTP